jgi:acyl dehydratase
MTAIIAACPVGEVRRGRGVTLSLGRILAFSGGPLDQPGWPARNLHTDRDKAREAGLEDIIASGTQFEGVLLTHLVSLFGPAWHRSGEIEARFIRSARVGDTVTPVAVVRERMAEGGSVRLGLDVWCERQDGEKLLVGRAIAELS